MHNAHIYVGGQIKPEYRETERVEGLAAVVTKGVDGAYDVYFYNQSDPEFIALTGTRSRDVRRVYMGLNREAVREISFRAVSLVHSPKREANLRTLDKLVVIPHFLQPLPEVAEPATR